MKSSATLPSQLALVLAALIGVTLVAASPTNSNGRPSTRVIDGQSRRTVAPMFGETCSFDPQSQPQPVSVSVPVNPVTVALAMQQAKERPAAFAMQQAPAARPAAPAAGPVSVPTAAKKAQVAARKAMFRIHDKYPQFSAVAVDESRNEVVMADENLFQMLVYDRTTNTPAKAAMSEPKRQIAGSETFLELQCAVYIDPKNGNIYSLNNDTERHMTVWDRTQKGNVPPLWKLHTPMGSFGLAVDEQNDLLLITGQRYNVIAAYPKTAREEDSPSWIIWGEKTMLADPHGIALDTKRNEIFVNNFGTTSKQRPLRPGEDPLKVATAGNNQYDIYIPGSSHFLPVSITVYDRSARNDAAPKRIITGPHTQLNWPTGMFVDAERGELYVANDGGTSILVFKTDAVGDAAPIRVLKGPHTDLAYPSSVYVDLKNDELWVANFGNHKATVYKRTAEGDTAPIRQIRSAPEGTPAPSLANVRIGYDTKREQILAPNCVAHPQIAIFARTANGQAETVRRIEGQTTLLGRTQHSISYDEIHDEIVVPQPFAGAILTFPGGANGEVKPTRIIQGPKTGLVLSDVLAIDPVHGEIVLPAGQGSGTIMVFDRMAQGDVAPLRTFGSRAAGLGGIPYVDSQHNLILTSCRQGLCIYDRMANGDAKPLRIITGGPNSGTTAPGDPVWIPGTRNFIGTTRRFDAPARKPGAPGNYQSTEEAQTFLAVWSIDDDGDVAPRYTIAHNIFKELRNIAVDPKHKTVIAADKTNNDINTWDFHEAWETFAPATAAPYVRPAGRGRGGDTGQ